MALTPTTLTDPLLLNLYKSYLLSLGAAPLIVGNDSNLRFQVLDDTGAAVSLSGASIEMEITFGDTTITLDTATLITGSIYEIAIDTDQSAETGYTGKGWYQVNNSSNSTFAAMLATVVGRGTYIITITFGSGSVSRHLMGKIDVLEA